MSINAVHVGWLYTRYYAFYLYKLLPKKTINETILKSKRELSTAVLYYNNVCIYNSKRNSPRLKFLNHNMISIHNTYNRL